MSWIAAGISIVGGLLSNKSSKKSAAKADKLAGEQAGLIEDETKENLRRMQLEADQVLGMTTARIGASNLMMSGSAKKYRSALEVQMAEDMDWVGRRGAAEAENVRKGGSQTASQIRGQGKSDLLGGIAQGIQYAGWGS